MATVQLPVDPKNLWRRLRAGLWCALVALAFCAWLLPEFHPIKELTPLRNWLILAAAAVVVWPFFAKRFGV